MSKNLKIFKINPAVRGLRHLERGLGSTLVFGSDILWWATFLEAWNGVSLLRDLTRQHLTSDVWTDASGSFGCGAWNPTTGEWVQLEWPKMTWLMSPEFQEGVIAWKELMPIVLACAIWERHWIEGMVTFHCDNMAAVSVINSGTAEFRILCTFCDAYFSYELTSS